MDDSNAAQASASAAATAAAVVVYRVVLVSTNGVVDGVPRSASSRSWPGFGRPVRPRVGASVDDEAQVNAAGATSSVP